MIYCCIIATATKWEHVSLFLESKKSFLIRLDSSIFVYTRLVTRLHSSTRLVTRLHSFNFVYTRLWLVYIRLHSSCDSSTLVYLRLHSSVTRLHSSTLVCTRLVACLCFQNRYCTYISLRNFENYLFFVIKTCVFVHETVPFASSPLCFCWHFFLLLNHHHYLFSYWNHYFYLFNIIIIYLINAFYHCVKSVQIRSFFWSVFSPNAGKYGPEKTPYLDTFHAVNVSFTSAKSYYLACLKGQTSKNVFTSKIIQL